MSRAPLPPETKGKIAEVYARTGNACETARQCGVSEKTVRNVMTQSESPKRSELNARAVAKGLRTGRRELLKGIALVTRYFEEHCGDTLDLEPGDVARLLTAQGGAVARLIDLDAHSLERRKGRLTRELTRAQIELTRARASGKVTERAIVVTQEDLDEMMRREFGTVGAPPTKALDGSPREPGPDSVAPETVPVAKGVGD